jgi:hypothetical protein
MSDKHKASVNQKMKEVDALSAKLFQQRHLFKEKITAMKSD